MGHLLGYRGEMALTKEQARELKLPLCAYFAPDPEIHGVRENAVFSDFHYAGEGPLFFFVPVADGAAVRVPVCEEHCAILKRQFGKP
jgi:hypothetical protein